MTGVRPAWLASRPGDPPDAATVTAFDRLFDELVSGGGGEIEYRLAAPKWQFLCHLGDTGRVVLHGSNNGEIAEFEPRQANDVNAFGAQCAVYASTDGIWPMYFALIDRARYQGMLVNSCVRTGADQQPGYFFSIDPSSLGPAPWRSGWIYLLPPETFRTEVLDDVADGPVVSTQCVSVEPVTPLGRLAVEPGDFPFLAEVRQHRDAVLLERARACPDGFPWLDA